MLFSSLVYFQLTNTDVQLGSFLGTVGDSGGCGLAALGIELAFLLKQEDITALTHCNIHKWISTRLILDNYFSVMP